MRIARRCFLSLMAGAAAYTAAPRLAYAEAYPARPVRLVVPQAVGGAADIGARLVAQWLAERLGQPFVVENKPGAGGNIGTEAVVSAQADGHTLLLAGSFNAINASLYDKLAFDFIRDIAPVAGIMRNPLIMAVPASLPVGTVAEFIAYAKTNPGRLNMGSAGKGSPQHMAGELFKSMTGLDIVHVPYRGSAPMLTDLIRGEVHVAFDPMLSSLEHVRSGKLRALAVTTARRSDVLPDTPGVGEFVPGYETFGWIGIGAPKGTATDIVEKLNAEINAGLAEARISRRLADLGGSPMPGTVADFAQLIADQTRRWGAVIRAANIKPD